MNPGAAPAVDLVALAVECGLVDVKRAFLVELMTDR